MYALKVEEYNGISECEGIRESGNDNLFQDSFAETTDQLADQITLLAGQINAANYRFLKLIAEFDRRQAWEGYGIRSCAHWLNWKCGIAMTAAREKVRTARALEGLPKINEAFQKGELSYSKVRAMSRVATTENEDYLLNIAEYGTAQHMEVLVKAFRTVSRIEKFDMTAINDANLGTSEEKKELNLQQRQQEDRSVSCYQDDDGMWIIKAKLPPEEGGLIAKALKELGDRIADSKPDRADISNETPQDSAKSVSAETFSRNFQEEKKEEKKEERISCIQRRADALVALA